MTLTKRELVMRIGEETGLIQTQVFDVVQKTLDQISEALAKGGKVELRNFGVFEVKTTKTRVGSNPARTAAHCSPSKATAARAARGGHPGIRRHPNRSHRSAGCCRYFV